MKYIKPLPQLLTQKQVCESLNVGRTWLWRAETEGRYPKGTRYSKRCVRYHADLHEQFINGTWGKAANDG
ncbi:hypothetical protein A9267_10005 [Shewanella sp. UCD-FRSSP16_17]|uniref:helix-turn-helix transcriptional regulator n=1 Tax=Shewanella sp. UCD-FRSSP16_17 TaxID=1853256 RepID=UPI0007EEE4F8|nr:hypothetical protein [Shewanella sp. UCD-FRSSP16_17]OBT08050.1 hypothetical protein A9267_10005 [Shewanella sp. UCD-FRSSP16_17]